MNKRFKAAILIKDKINKASDAMIAKAIEKYGALDGREEEFTSRLSEKIDDMSIGLMEEIYDSLNGLQIAEKKNKKEEATSTKQEEETEEGAEESDSLEKNDELEKITFEVFTYKKTKEAEVGADFCGVISLELGGVKIQKAFLAQAKICNAKVKEINEEIEKVDEEESSEEETTPKKAQKPKKKKVAIVHFYGQSSMDILEQAKKMLEKTSDSFFFFYTAYGIFVVPAFSILLANKNTHIHSKYYFYQRIGTFYQEFLKCFIGDHKIGNLYEFPVAEILKKSSSPIVHDDDDIAFDNPMDANLVQIIRITDKKNVS